jgi:hypothetical protein
VAPQSSPAAATRSCLPGLRADRERWLIADELHDHAISGATLLRLGFQALMRRALDREFDIVLAESLDRFSRDQESGFERSKRFSVEAISLSRRDSEARRRGRLDITRSSWIPFLNCDKSLSS